MRLLNNLAVGEIEGQLFLAEGLLQAGPATLARDAGRVARSDATHALCAYTQAREHHRRSRQVISKGDFSQTAQERPRLLLEKSDLAGK